VTDDPPAPAALPTGPDAIVVTDPAGRVTLWNPAAEALLGMPAADVVGGPVPDVVYGVDPARRAALQARVTAGEQVSELVTTSRADGRRIDLLAGFGPLRDAAGQRVGTVGVLKDVTTTQAAERALRTRAALVDRLHAVVLDLNAHADLSVVLRRITDACVELLDSQAAGYAILDGSDLRIAAVSGGVPDELVGDRVPYDGSALHELVTQGRPSMAAALDRFPGSVDRLRPHLGDKRILVVARTVVQDVVTGALYAFFPDRGRPVCASELAVVEQLAGHAGAAIANARAYADAVRQRERERAVLDAMADGMAVVDEESTVLEWNPAAAEMTGLAAAEVVGRPLPFPLPAPGDRPLDHELSGGRWIEILVTPIAGTAERVVDFRDITEPKRLEDAKDLFLATTGHELRTPITVMKGFAETLLHRWDLLDDGERRSGVEVIVHRTEALAGLVERLLLGSRVGVGVAVEPVPLDAGMVLGALVAAFRDFSPRHDVALVVEPGLPPVLADRVAFDNVVGQLLENAIKYSPDGGRVEVSAQRHGDEVVVAVSDEGVGIAPEHVERVFERFFQADAGDRRRFGGVGLGLFIVRQLVEDQGGRVRAVPQPVGARIEVTLPAAR
jgi:PAS domain S-box-containing protein